MKTCLLLSGGADSIALCYALRPTLALTVDYGQAAAAAEIAASQAVCRLMSIEHKVLTIDCLSLGAGDMSRNISTESHAKVAPSPEWWPFRNQLLLTFGSAICLRHGLEEIVIGTVLTDRIHADGQPGFVETIAALLAMQEGSIKTSAPAIEMKSADLVRWSGIPVEVLAWAHSCHRGNLCCGTCRGCQKLLALWDELGIRDASSITASIV